MLLYLMMYGIASLNKVLWFVVNARHKKEEG